MRLFSFILIAHVVAASWVDSIDQVNSLLVSHEDDLRERATAPMVRRELGTGQSLYLNDKTKQFAVDGTNFPLVDFDIGESYAGLLPISDKANETRKLFFWFFPSTNVDASNEITIWLQGGPGASSLLALLQENGPFLWQPGTLKPVPNPYSWNNLTNMIWIEQPVGTGYSEGVPNLQSLEQLAIEFQGFYKNFVDAFAVQNRKIYLTGESFSGFMVPYIANQFIKSNDTTNFNVAGIALNSPLVGNDIIQQQLTVVPFIDFWANLVFLNNTFLAEIHQIQDECGFTAYYDTYLKFPAVPGPFPDPSSRRKCYSIFNKVWKAAEEVNPCFNVYHITESCPFPYTVLGKTNPFDYEPKGSMIYFNRDDVKQALHVPTSTKWRVQTKKEVFVNNTFTSLPPAINGVLSNVIEHTNNAIIGNGDVDMLIPTNGTLLVLQNMTWNGAQGFTTPPSNDFFSPYHPRYSKGALASAGIVGKWVSERGLTFYTVRLAGHELPAYAPGPAYRVLEKLLGRVPSLSTMGDFTTQSGNFSASVKMF